MGGGGGLFEFTKAYLGGGGLFEFTEPDLREPVVPLLRFVFIGEAKSEPGGLTEPTEAAVLNDPELVELVLIVEADLGLEGGAFAFRLVALTALLVI